MRLEETTADISQITDQLFISSWPEGKHYQEIVDLNIRLILSMHWIRPSRTLNQPPLKLLWLWTIDTPLTPMPIWSTPTMPSITPASLVVRRRLSGRAAPAPSITRTGASLPGSAPL